MMATVALSSSSLLPLLESLEDTAAGVSEQTDAYLTIANRLTGEDGRQFFPIVVKHFPRLGKAFQIHISSENEELSQAALQALGFCVFNTNIVSGIPATFAEEILSVLCALVLKSSDKNTCTRALWVISKQNFPAEVVSKKTPEILKTLEAMQTKDIQSILMDHESLNVVIKLLEQAPAQMTEGATVWAKLVIPLVVHSASKVRLRAAAALEMGMPLLLEKQPEVAAIIEPMMSSKLIPEMQKLFSTKNESNVLKLWPLFVRLLGKLLHKGGAFINSLLYLEELGFRSSSPSIKKIAFIAWKSLIDNFALNPDILCSSKRLKLLMQPLSSILVRTEALLLTKLEVWWYLVVKLGPNLAANFDQVGVPLLHSTLPPDASLQCPVTPARGASQSNGIGLATPKAGVPSCSAPGASPRTSLGGGGGLPQSYASMQLLGLEMLLHYFLGSQATAASARSKLQLGLEPLTHNLLSSHSFFSKHASTLISAVRDGFIAVGKNAPEALLSLIWNSLVNLVSTMIEAVGNKKERQASEVLTLLLQALKAVLCSEALPAPRALILLEATVKGIPPKVLGSAVYQVANMDILNGTPALFLIHLIYNNGLLSTLLADERFFLCLETLVSCGLSGPTSPLAFGEAVLGALSQSVEAVENREHLWRMWSVIVSPLTDTITQTNEVNQGDALEHNFRAVHCALMFPVNHLLRGSALPQTTQKSMLSTWSRLYKAFARCSALVATAEENVCCEELCTKISASLDGEALKCLSTLDGITNILLVIVESLDFSPFTPQFQQKMKSPHTPLRWVRKKSKALGNLSSFHVLLVKALEAFLALNSPEESGAILSVLGPTLISIACSLFNNLALPTVIQESLACLVNPLALFYRQEESSECEQSKSHTVPESKLEKLLAEMLGCLQTRSALQYDDELLALLSPLLCVAFPHKSKQIRTVVTQFWNATFGNTLVLTYPDMLKHVLSQAKLKAPLILPGFQAVETSEDFSGQCSSECSQLDAEISGIKVTSVGKRESLLARAAELTERGPAAHSKPVSVKLDFGSPKVPRREALEEEASVDFVFIPPQTKERVLTEHQKEVKRTKRVDIPTMYNNLDASLDTTVFTQYTQSQEESVDKLQADEQDETKEVSAVETEALETKESFISSNQEAEDMTPGTPEKETNHITEILPANLSVSDLSVGQHEDPDKKGNSPNVSASSDMISGTPPKPCSRRQSFITLEKYVEGRPSSPMSVTKFTGALTRTYYSQDTAKSQQLTPDGSYCSQPEEGKGASKAFPRNMAQHVPQKTEETSTELKPSEGTEDLIPDTHSQDLNDTSNSGEKCLDRSNLEVETEMASLEDDSETVAASSQVEPRRSGRRRSRPVRPGDESTDQESKNKQQKRHSVNELTLTDAQKSSSSKPMDSVLLGRSRRSKLLEENKSENGRSQNSELKDEHSQTNSQGSSQGRSRRSKSRELSQTELASDKRSTLSQTENERESPLSQSQSQSHTRPLRRTRVVGTGLEDALGKRQKVEGSQSDSQVDLSIMSSDAEAGGQSPGRPKRMKKSEMLDAQSQDKPGIKNDTSQSDSQTLMPVKGRVGRRKKVNDSSATSPSGILGTECSLTDGTSEVQDSSQRTGKYKTRRTTQSLSEGSECDACDIKKGQEQKSKIDSQSQVSDSIVNDAVSEDSPDKMLGKDTNIPLLPMEDFEKDPKDCLEISILHEDEVLKTEHEVTESDISDAKPSEVEQQNESTMQNESHKIEMISADIEEKSTEEGTVLSSQNSLVLPEKVELKTPQLHRCPHTKRGRGRRRSTSCNCLLASSATPQESSCSDSQVSQDLGDGITFEPVSLPSKSEPSIVKPVLVENESVAHADACSVVISEDCPLALANSIDAQMPTENPEKNLDEAASLLPVMKDPTQEEEKENVDDAEDKHPDGESNTSTSENLDQDQPQSSSPQDHSLSQSKPVLDETVCQKQSESPVNQEEMADLAVNENVENLEMPEKEDLEHGMDGGDITSTSEGTELDGSSHLEGDDEEAHIEDKELQPDTNEYSEPVLPLQSTLTETCLDSPPKQMSLDHCRDELGHSPNSGVMRGVWSPSASPSTSILKKGQKRPCEEDSPSPLLKSRRVSFANPIYQQEMADDIDRRSPVIRTSSPRSKATGQPKYVATPTKGLLTLSPRNLRSPGYKSSKKCLISEMSQEPRPISKDCVYPALVGCSTPVEAVLPQISSNMWPRGFGQLVRARNIKTVGDLSALTSGQIKLLPIRSPKLSNVRKALKAYHEQQRKGRSDDLKCFDETEKMTSEPEEMDTPSNPEEEQISEDPKEIACSDVPAAFEQKQEEPLCIELLSDMVALRARLTNEELSHCSPSELVRMHENLSGMMRNIVDHLQSRIVNLEDSLP